MDSFMGEIRAFGFNFAPYQWASCDGQIVPIQQNTVLFSILGTTFGGNGTTTFGLPNLQGSAPVGCGQGPGLTNRVLGETLGAPSVALTADNFPAHTHSVQVLNGNATNTTATTNVLAKAGEPSAGKFKAVNMYSPAAATHTHLAADAVQSMGTAAGSVTRSTLQPYLPVLLCISLFGAFPPRS